MSNQEKRIYAALVLLLAGLGALAAFLPQGQIAAIPIDQELPASEGIIALVSGGSLLVVYGGLGLLGLRLARALGWASILDDKVSHRQRFLIPALAGAVLGVVFIVADALFARWHGASPLMHPPFPLSLVASITAAIGEELIFRLFLMTFWAWLIGVLLLKSRGQQIVFWAVAVFSALAFAAGHLPGVMLMMGMTQVAEISPLLLIEIVLLNGVLSLFAADYLRRYGLLAAIGVHFWADIVWHVIWGLIS